MKITRPPNKITPPPPKQKFLPLSKDFNPPPKLEGGECPVEGSNNYHSSNAIDHAINEQHKIRFNKCIKDNSLSLMEVIKVILLAIEK